MAPREHAIDALNHAGRLRQRGQEVLPPLRPLRQRRASLFWTVRPHRLQTQGRRGGPRASVAVGDRQVHEGELGVGVGGERGAVAGQRVGVALRAFIQFSLEPREEETTFEDPEALEAEVERLQQEMLQAAERLDFERAAECRDRIRYLRERAVLSG